MCICSETVKGEGGGLRAEELNPILLCRGGGRRDGRKRLSAGHGPQSKVSASEKRRQSMSTGGAVGGGRVGNVTSIHADTRDPFKARSGQSKGSK